jgi:hypothetical protein
MSATLPTIGFCRLPRMNWSMRPRFVKAGPVARFIAATLDWMALPGPASIGSSMP